MSILFVSFSQLEVEEEEEGKSGGRNC